MLRLYLSFTWKFVKIEALRIKGKPKVGCSRWTSSLLIRLIICLPCLVLLSFHHYRLNSDQVKIKMAFMHILKALGGQTVSVIPYCSNMKLLQVWFIKKTTTSTTRLLKGSLIEKRFIERAVLISFKWTQKFFCEPWIDCRIVVLLSIAYLSL